MSQWRDGQAEDAEGPARPNRRIDSPLSWSIPFGRIARIEIRLHLLLPLFLLIELLRSWVGHSALGPLDTSIALACLFLSLLLHELGHCFVCRRLGGSADEVLLWPLGGLAGCHPPHDWRSHFWTSAAGPLVNLALLAFAAACLAATGAAWLGVAIPHPLRPWSGLEAIGDRAVLRAFFLLGWVNSILLLLNLVPMLPLDGGRMLQALLWRRRGAVDATLLAVRVGFVSAVVLAAGGLLLDRLLLLGLAVLGGIWCWQVARQLQEREGEGAVGDALPAGAFAAGGSAWSELSPPPANREELRAERRRREREAAALAERRELDRILDKIAAKGMRSLTLRERWGLWRATRRRRRRRSEPGRGDRYTSRP